MHSFAKTNSEIRKCAFEDVEPTEEDSREMVRLLGIVISKLDNVYYRLCYSGEFSLASISPWAKYTSALNKEYFEELDGDLKELFGIVSKLYACKRE